MLSGQRAKTGINRERDGNLVTTGTPPSQVPPPGQYFFQEREEHTVNLTMDVFVKYNGKSIYCMNNINNLKAECKN